MAFSKKNKPVRKAAAKVPAPRKPLGIARQIPQTPAPRPAAKPAPARTAVPGAALAALTAEVAAVKARLLKEHESAPLGSDEEYDALRRLVNDLLERRMERVVRDLVEIRGAACLVAGGEAVVQALDAVLERMGAVRFEGQRLDHVDPLIHAVSREAHEQDLPDGVIAEPLRSGFRTARGVILAKAQVAVNRRT